jgi:hypothetical protein
MASSGRPRFVVGRPIKTDVRGGLQANGGVKDGTEVSLGIVGGGSGSSN